MPSIAFYDCLASMMPLPEWQPNRSQLYANNTPGHAPASAQEGKTAAPSTLLPRFEPQDDRGSADTSDSGSEMEWRDPSFDQPAPVRPPRHRRRSSVGRVAYRWRLSLEDAQELCDAVEAAQSAPVSSESSRPGGNSDALALCAIVE